MDERKPSVSIIIPTKNGAWYLRLVLGAILSQQFPGVVEVIVIDSGSSDGTLGIVAEYPQVRLHKIPPREFGHGKTRNLGASLSKGEFLVFIPQDATPDGPHWLRALLQPFADPAVAGVYARQVPRAEANVMETFFLNEAYPDKPERRQLLAGQAPSLSACFFSTVSGAVRAAVWRTFPFREDIIMSEDQAWASDVMQAGHAIAYEPSAKVIHSHQYRMGGVFRRNFDSGYSIRQIFDGHTGISPWRAAWKLVREMFFVMRKGGVPDLLRFFPYEAARHIGFLLGLHAERLPAGMRRKFSSLAYFWERSAAAED